MHCDSNSKGFRSCFKKSSINANVALILKHLVTNMPVHSTNQIEMLRKTLPDIEKELADKRDEYKEQLKKYGHDLATEGQRRQEFCRIVNELGHLVRETVRGSNSEWDAGDGFNLRARMKKMYQQFAMDMHKTPLAGYAGDKGAKVFVTANGKRLRGTIVKVTKFQKAGTAFKVEPDESVAAEDAKAMIYVTKQKKAKYRLISEKNISPDNYDSLKKAIERQQIRGLPIFPSVELFNHLVSDAVCADWKKLCLDLVDEAYALVKKFLKWAMEKVCCGDGPVLHSMHDTDCMHSEYVGDTRSPRALSLGVRGHCPRDIES